MVGMVTILAMVREFLWLHEEFIIFNFQPSQTYIVMTFPILYAVVIDKRIVISVSGQDL